MWLVVIANSLPIGVSGVWGPVLGVNMKPVGVSQVQLTSYTQKEISSQTDLYLFILSTKTYVLKTN